MTFKAIAKRILTRSFPESVLQYMRESFYCLQVKSFSENAEPDLYVVRNLVAAGDTVVDIGANIGDYTVFLSRYTGNTGKVYSIEPIPVTYRVLSKIAERLKLHNVVLFNCALSEKNGRAVMEVPTYRSGDENFYQARIIDIAKQHAARRHFEVEVKTLDSLLLMACDRIDFIKIDVEGHELQVLRGARELLQKFKPALLIEISGDPDDGLSTASRVVHELEQKGYAPFWYDGVGLKHRTNGVKSVNYFFLLRDHIETMKRKNQISVSEGIPARRA